MSQRPFTPYATVVLRRVDQVLAGQDCPWALPDGERALLLVLQPHVGKHDPVTLPALKELLQTSERHVKAMVSTLRKDFRIQIGASREGGRGGYYLISNAAEAHESTQYLVSQATAMFRVVRVMRGRQATAELLGQIGLELNLDQEEAHVA
jgi:hypothetical protein